MIAGILGAAISGINLNSQRASAAAKNIANVSTPGYRPEKVEARTVVTGDASQNGYQSGGVQGVIRPPENVQTIQEARPSGTDLATEFTNLILAEKAYSASLKAVDAAEDMSEHLLDVIG